MPARRKYCRPRVSLRTLFVLLTLLCVYLAGYAPTQKWGLGDIETYSDERFLYGPEFSPRFNGVAVSYLPLQVHRFEFNPVSNKRYRRFYVWFYGYVKPLPSRHDHDLLLD